MVHSRETRDRTHLTCRSRAFPIGDTVLFSQNKLLTTQKKAWLDYPYSCPASQHEYLAQVEVWSTARHSGQINTQSGAILRNGANRENTPGDNR